MRKIGVGLAMFLVLVLAAAPAMAAGPYFGVQAGAVFLSESDITQAGLTATADFDAGWGASVAAGYSFDLFRLEGELFYKTNGVDTVSLVGIEVPGDGDFTSMGIMLNAYYDFKTGSPITPYIGAGIGMAQVSVEEVVIAGVPFADDDDTVVAYQLIAGIGYAVSPTLTLDLAYKYLGTADPEFTDVTGFPFEAEYQSHNVMLGLRFTF